MNCLYHGQPRGAEGPPVMMLYCPNYEYVIRFPEPTENLSYTFLINRCVHPFKPIWYPNNNITSLDIEFYTISHSKLLCRWNATECEMSDALCKQFKHINHPTHHQAFHVFKTLSVRQMFIESSHDHLFENQISLIWMSSGHPMNSRNNEHAICRLGKANISRIFHRP